MINEINHILLLFRSCFSHEAAFNWFVIVVMGFIVRLDHHGVTSMIRWLDEAAFAAEKRIKIVYNSLIFNIQPNLKRSIP